MTFPGLLANGSEDARSVQNQQRAYTTLENYSTEFTTKKALFRRRLKRLRKRRPTTTTERSITTTLLSTLEDHQTHQRKKKRRQKKKLIKHKNDNPEPKNLILPMPPTKSRITRCSIKNGGCAHICNVKGPNKCECFKGFKLLEDNHRCSGNLEQFTSFSHY